MGIHLPFATALYQRGHSTAIGLDGERRHNLFSAGTAATGLIASLYKPITPV